MDKTLHVGAGCSMMVGSSHGKQKGSTPVPPDEFGVEPGGESRAVGAGHRAVQKQGTGVPGPVRTTGDRGARVRAADHRAAHGGRCEVRLRQNNRDSY